MRVFKPDYYDEFNCIASACDFTCCQEWTIAVDEDTFEKWHDMKVPEEAPREKHREVLEGGRADDVNLSDFAQPKFENYAIKLNENGKCPFLNKQGLCHLVLKYGEECLSKTCHTFPREKHEFSSRVEYALSLGCKHALECMWAKDDFCVLSAEEVGATSRTEEVSTSELSETQFMIRDWFIEIASDQTLPVTKTLKVLFYLILDLYEMNEKKPLTEKSFLAYKDSGILMQVTDVLQADKQEKAQKSKSFQGEVSYDTFLEDNELLLDIAENYRKKKIYADYLNPIALRAEHYEKKSALRGLQDRLDRFSEIWRNYETKMRILICEELYSSSLLPDSTMYHMVMKLEWLAIEYAVIRQWMFLQWDMAGALTFEDLKTAVSVIFRMTGYSDDDIEEYLDHSFQSVIWDWGYLALII